LYSRVHNDRHNENKECKLITNHLRKIECVAYHRIPGEDFSNTTELKLGKRSKRCTLPGYTDTTKIWHLWDFSGQGGKGCLIRSSDIIFIEEENAFTDQIEIIPNENLFPDNEIPSLLLIPSNSISNPKSLADIISSKADSIKMGYQSF
jgi:hypothetical protein